MWGLQGLLCVAYPTVFIVAVVVRDSEGSCVLVKVVMIPVGIIIVRI